MFRRKKNKAVSIYILIYICKLNGMRKWEWEIRQKGKKKSRKADKKKR